MAVSTDSQENRDPLLTDDAQATREPHETRTDDDLTLLTETLEEVLKSSGDPTDQKYIELKAKAEQALHDVKARVSAASDSYYYRAKKRPTAPTTTCTKNRGRASASAQPPVWFSACCWRAAKLSPSYQPRPQGEGLVCFTVATPLLS